MNKPLKIVFMGTPQFAVPSLEMLVSNGFDVCGVFTQPDTKAGRGNKVKAPPVKVFAEDRGLPVYQFTKVSKEGLETLISLQPDALITCAYGQLLSEAVLAVAPQGCINVHGSLLPKYRGAAPIEWAVINGETHTGITTMFTVKKLDAGDMLEKDEIEILPTDTAGTLREKLSALGAQTLLRTLQKLQEGTLMPSPQEEAQVSFAPSFKKGFGLVDFAWESDCIVNFIRGTNPEPGAYSYLQGTKVKLLFAKKTSETVVEKPGTITVANPKKGLFVAAIDGEIEIVMLQYPGGKAMAAKDFLRGRGQFIEVGMRFEGESA